MVQAQRYYMASVSATTPIPNTEMPAQLSRPVRSREKYKVILHSLGIAELVLGVISCLLGIVAIAVVYYPYDLGSVLTYSAQGIWCGALLIASGVLGIKARSHPSVCIYNSNMAISIIAATFMGILVILSGMAAAVPSSKILLALHAIVGVIGFAGMVIAIIHSAYCCAGVCCRNSRAYQGTVMYIPHNWYLQQPQLMMQLPNGQYMSVPVTGAAMTCQQGTSMPQRQILYPSTSSNRQPATTKEQESQMQGAVDSPPHYNLLPDHNA